MSEPLTRKERALFEQTFAALQEREAELADLQRALVNEQRKRAAADTEVRGLRSLIRTMSETTGRSGFRVDLDQTETGGMRFTIASSAGAEREMMQARMVAGVMSALLGYSENEPEDADVAPDEPEQPEGRTETQEAKDDLRRYLLGDDAQ